MLRKYLPINILHRFKLFDKFDIIFRSLTDFQARSFDRIFAITENTSWGGAQSSKPLD